MSSIQPKQPCISVSPFSQRNTSNTISSAQDRVQWHSGTRDRMFGCSVEISCGTSKFHQYSFPPSRLTYFGTYIDLCGSNAVHLPLSAFLALSAMLRVISRPTLRNPLEGPYSSQNIRPLPIFGLSNCTISAKILNFSASLVRTTCHCSASYPFLRANVKSDASSV